MISYFLNKLVSYIPNRFYKLKVYFWNIGKNEISSSARICSSVKLVGNVNLKIGENTFIGHFTKFLGGESTIDIGRNCDVSSKVMFITGSHSIDMEGVRVAGKGSSLSIYVGEGSWIGASVTVLGGVRIGKKSIIAAGALVNKDVEPYSMVGGVPARILKKWNKSKKEWEKI